MYPTLMHFMVLNRIFVCDRELLFVKFKSAPSLSLFHASKKGKSNFPNIERKQKIFCYTNTKAPAFRDC